MKKILILAVLAVAVLFVVTGCATRMVVVPTNPAVTEYVDADGKVWIVEYDGPQGWKFENVYVGGIFYPIYWTTDFGFYHSHSHFYHGHGYARHSGRYDHSGHRGYRHHDGGPGGHRDSGHPGYNKSHDTPNKGNIRNTPRSGGSSGGGTRNVPRSTPRSGGGGGRHR